jgi:hypothetical protein
MIKNTHIFPLFLTKEKEMYVGRRVQTGS